MALLFSSKSNRQQLYYALSFRRLSTFWTNSTAPMKSNMSKTTKVSNVNANSINEQHALSNNITPQNNQLTNEKCEQKF